MSAVLMLAEQPTSELGRRLVSIAEAWGRDVAGEAFATAPPGEPLPDAVARGLAGREGPLLVIWPCLSRWRPESASGALGDLAAGCDLVLGPTMDAGLYLLGVNRPLPGLLEQFEPPLTDDAVVLGAQAAQAAGIEIGLLRAERALRTAADRQAALLDPLTPPELMELLLQQPVVGANDE